LAHLGTLRIAIAQVADEYGFLRWMKMWNPARTSLDADAASGALLFVDQNSLCFGIY
jgi:hypothetical protein